MASYLEYDELSIALSYVLAMGGQSESLPPAPKKEAAPPKTAAPAVAASEIAVDDMFGDDDDDDETADEKAATQARRLRMETARKLKEEKDAKDGAKPKKEKAPEKSLVCLEVKPWEADTDLKKLWEEIIKYEQEGLSWGQSYKLEPVAYGIMKLVMTCTIIDSLVLMDDITDNIEKHEDYVQSVQVASMNKIT
eukprot:gene1937-3757_t